MSKMTNSGLIQSGNECFTYVLILGTLGINGITVAS